MRVGTRCLTVLAALWVANGCVDAGGAVGARQDALGVDAIVDDGNAGWTATAAWFSSANAGYYGTGSHVCPAGNGSEVATWTATLPHAGTYRVWAWWVASSNRAPDASYVVDHSGGSASVAVDQRANGSRWNLLGTYSFGAGAARVELSNAASSGYVSADAIRFEPLDHVVDDGSNGYGEIGAWASSANAGHYGTESRYTQAGSGESEARWELSVDADGDYEVHAWWVASSNRAPDAKYRVEHADGTAVIEVDQRVAGSRWNLLGTYRLQAGVTYAVRLRNDATASTIVSADAVRLARPNRWGSGSITALPPASELRPLPGGGNEVPSIVSNNPEIFTGAGLLFGTGSLATRGGTPHHVSGDFSVYLHHINQSGGTRYVQVIVTNPGSTRVNVSGYGSGYNSGETGGLPIGGSPDYEVSHDFATGAYTTTVGATSIRPNKALQFWVKAVGDGQEIDARFALHASGPVRVYVVATSTNSVHAGVDATTYTAPGEIAAPGTPPPPFGREAGVYDGDTWTAEMTVDVPPSGQRIGWLVNTATGTGLSQVQAFPALMNYADSAAEAVGMYGNFYDVTLHLRHDGSDATARTVSLALGSYGAGMPSRFWDGAAWVNGTVVHALNTPAQRIDTLYTASVAPGATVTVHLRAMVPGLTSIYQGLWLASE